MRYRSQFFGSLLVALLAAAISLITGCNDSRPLPSATEAEPTLDEMLAQLPDETTAAPAANWGRFTGDVAYRWYRLTDKIVRNEKLNPPVTSRLYGYIGVALYETVRPGNPRLMSLAGQVNELKPAPFLGSLLSHWPTAANVTLALTIKGIMPNLSSASLASIDSLRNLIAAEYKDQVPKIFLLFGTARGILVSKHIVDYAATDGFASLNNCTAAIPTGPGYWVPTPPAFAAPLQPCWGELRPFVIERGESCQPIPPTSYSTDTASQFFHEASEVYTTSKTLTDEQKTIALYWADGAGSGTPPGHSLMMLTQLLAEKQATLFEASEAYAKVGMGEADAFISCWWTKYHYNLLRPVTYIRAQIDSTWLPFIATPPFPEYTSGHSVQSGASSEILTSLFGNRPFVDSSQIAYGKTPRAFASFYAAADEAAISRLYGGIHYRPAIELGIDQGRCIGAAVNAIKTQREGHHVGDDLTATQEIASK